MQNFSQSGRDAITRTLNLLKTNLEAHVFAVTQGGADPVDTMDFIVRPLVKDAEKEVTRLVNGEHRSRLVAEVEEREIYVKGKSKAAQAVLVKALVPAIMNEGPHQEVYETLRKAASSQESRKYAIQSADKTLRHWATLVEGKPERRFRTYASMKDALAELGRVYIWKADGTPVVTAYTNYTEPNPEPVGNEAAMAEVGQLALTSLLNGEATNLNSLAQIRVEDVYPFMQTDLAYKQVVQVTIGALSEGHGVKAEVYISSTSLADFTPRGW